MGIIIKQSIKGTIWSYIGVVIGFITTSFLYPRYLTTDVVGLFSLLLAWSALFAQFASLGFNGVTTRLFPYFRSKENNHNGFLFIAFMVMSAGFILFLFAFSFISPILVEKNIEKSTLFAEYINLLIPITFFLLFFGILDNFNKLLYNAVLGTFLNEFLQRLLILIIIIFFVFKIINIQQLIFAYAIAVSAKGTIMFLYLLFTGEIHFKPKFSFLGSKLRKEMVNVGAYSILASLGTSIVFSIDKIVINQMLGLGATGVYTIAFYFGTLVVIPSRPLLRISGTLIADAWKKNDVAHVFDIYKKSCLNQFIIAAFLFGGIWININSIIEILGPDYSNGKWVIFFIGLGYLIDMATGANALVIGYSKHYKVALWFILFLILLVLITMYLFIPIWGITGAAIAIALSFFLNNLMRYLYLYKKFGMQPFDFRFLLVIVSFFVAFGVAYFIPQQALVLDILMRGVLFAVTYLVLVLGLKVSIEINETIHSFLKRF